MNITNLIPLHKKLRRSVRLLSKLQDENSEGNFRFLGHLELIPTEILHKIFDMLSVKELSILTICSKKLREQVIIYTNTAQVRRKLFPIINGERSYTSDESRRLKAHFYHLGLLIKRTTCLQPTKERLKIMFLYAGNLKHDPTTKQENVTLSLQCLGVLVHTVIAGWDECECTFVDYQLDNFSRMTKHVKKVLESPPGSFSKLEMYVRLYYRKVYVEFVSPYEKSFWLSCIFKPWPLVHKAKLLYLLGGPVIQEKINWWEMSESFVPNNPSICDMARMMRTLQTNPEWSKDNLITVIEELADISDEWLEENTAMLLYCCGKPLVITFAWNKLVNGKIAQLSSLITHLAVLLKRYDRHLGWLVNVIDDVCKLSENETDKLEFIKAIPERFRESICDFQDLANYVTDEEREAEYRLLIEAQSDFMAAVITRAFGATQISMAVEE